MDSGGAWRLGHRPALDGLRGVALLLVLICHSFYGAVTGFGPVGVTVFFTLSGFLITRLLLDESLRRGKVEVGRFYLRRARRLAPALAVFVVLSQAMYALAGGDRVGWTIAAALLYLGNVPSVFADLQDQGLGHLWSLAVEEQFYIVWPLLLIAALKAGGSRAVAVVATCGIVASVALRHLWWADPDTQSWVYLSAPTRADALLVGALLAALAGRLPSVPPTASRSALGASLAGLALLGFVPAGSDWGMLAVPAAAPWLTAAAIWCALDSRGLLTWGPLRLVGQRSYGLYLWHLPALGIALSMGMPVLVALLAGWSATWGLAALSWRYVEQPCLVRFVVELDVQTVTRRESHRECVGHDGRSARAR